jgi:hypothetical protein
VNALRRVGRTREASARAPAQVLLTLRTTVDLSMATLERGNVTIHHSPAVEPPLMAHASATDSGDAAEQPPRNDGVQGTVLRPRPSMCMIVFVWLKFLSLAILVACMLLAALPLLLLAKCVYKWMSNDSPSGQEPLSASARRAFLVTVSELVGPAGSMPWLNQFRALALLSLKLQLQSTQPILWLYFATVISCFTSAEMYIFGRFITLSLDRTIRTLMEQGYTEDEALSILLIVVPHARVIGYALQNGDAAFAPSCHAVAATLAKAAARNSLQGVSQPNVYIPMARRATGFHVEGIEVISCLTEHEPSLADVETPHVTGFRGGVRYAPLVAYESPAFWDAGGFRTIRQKLAARKVSLDEPRAADIACIRSQTADETGFHAPQWVDSNLVLGDSYCIPPNTLFRLEHVQQAPFTVGPFQRWHRLKAAGQRRDDPSETILIDRGGTTGHGAWSYYRVVQTPAGERFRAAKLFRATSIMRAAIALDSDCGADASSAEIGFLDPLESFTLTVHTGRLLTFTITFMRPAMDVPRGLAEASAGTQFWGAVLATLATTSKYGESVVTLQYLDRAAYVRGIEELTHGLNHGMEHEWTRSDMWTDWAGVEYQGAAVWAYVNGTATVATCTPGVRDENNVGRTVDDFVELANAHVGSRLPHALPSQLLSREEVIAVRLYTGPAFQPINAFLRRVGVLPTVESRRRAALDAASSYGATVGHLVSAIWKLSAANTEEEDRQTLYRGLKGAPPPAFWTPDAQGVVVATDVAFMSTSLGEATPIHYMAGEGRANLLWELHARPEDDTGRHRGADVSMLSQFAGERECLFPPLTMLRVLERSTASDAEVAPAEAAPPLQADSLAIEVNPTARAHSSKWKKNKRKIHRLSRLYQAESSREQLQVTTEASGSKVFERVAVIATFVG